jgi:hypothetical protein
MNRPSTSFQLDEMGTGDPHLYCLGSLTDRRYLLQLQQDPQDLRLRTAIAIHLPRITLMTFGVAGILFCLSGLLIAESSKSASSAHGLSSQVSSRSLGSFSRNDAAARKSAAQNAVVPSIARRD